MTRQRARIALAGLIGLALIAGMLLAVARPAAPALPQRPPAERPELMLLTSLPIVFSERLSLEAAGSPALDALQTRYRVIPISVTAATELGSRGLLLMAQPHAQPAEALVDLDSWVRAGGRVLLLADPALAWASERPLGDKLRPPTGFADTGLLGHWGLALEPPAQTGPAIRAVDGRAVRTVSAGRLVAAGPSCAIAGDGLVARCTIGVGKAIVIADSDFLDPTLEESADPAANFGFLLAELAMLEQ